MRSIVGMAVVICVLACSVQVVSGAQEPPAKITVRYEKATLPEVLKDLGAKLGVRLAFSPKTVAGAEPVTLDIQNGTPERVLRAVLRPRGLVAVHTGAKVAAILPAATDIGVAKTFGSAVRTSVRLAKKLEGAVQKGDEVHVPSWTGVDDEDLALAVADAVTSMLYLKLLKERSYGPEGVAAMVKRLTGSADAEVRAGAVLAHRAGCWGLNSKRRDQNAGPPDLLRRVFADPDPLVRGCWLAAVGRSSSVIADGEAAVFKDAVRAGLKDAAPEIRFAAAASMTFLRQGMDFPSPDPLTRDPHPAVRLAARAALLHLAGTAPRAEQRRQALVFLKDAHPIARTLALMVFAEELPRRLWKSEDIQALVKEAGGGKDEWLALPAHAYLTAALRRDKITDLKPLAAQLSSAKSGHRTLAMWALLMNRRKWDNMQDAFAEQKDAFARLADADQLFPRLLDLSIAVAQADATFPLRVAAGARSPKETMRVSALAALVIGLVNDSIERTPETDGTILEIARRPGLSEGLCGSYWAGRFLSGEKAVDALQREIRRDPSSLVAEMLLFGMMRNDQIQRQRTAEDQLWIEKMLDIVLAARSPRMEGLIGRWANKFSPFSEQQALVQKRMIEKLSPDAFLTLLRGRPFPMRLETDRLELAAAVHGRLRAVFDNGDAAVRKRAIGTLAIMLPSDNFYRTLAHYEKVGVATSEQSDALRDGQTLIWHMCRVSFESEADGASAALGLLEAVLERSQRGGDLWPGLPEPMEKTFVQALGFVNKPQCADASARILGALIRRNAMREPWDFDRFLELRTVMNRARDIVLDKGTLEQRFEVLCALSYCGKPDAVAKVAALFMDGKLSPEDAEKAIRAVGNVPAAVPEAFARHVIKLCGQKGTPWNVLQTAMHNLLRKLPQYRPETVAAYCQAVRHGQTTGCYLLMVMIQSDQMAARKNGAPAPPWVKAAAEVAHEVLGKEDLSPYSRSHALQLYMWAAGRKADPMTVAFLRDESIRDGDRSDLARGLAQAVPQTEVYKILLPKYDKLASRVRGALGASAAQSPDAPQAEAFLIRVLRDRTVEYRSHDMYLGLKLPWTPELDVALADLSKGSRSAGLAKMALRALRAGRPPRVVKPVIVLPDP
jgi:hypothetical protein